MSVELASYGLAPVSKRGRRLHYIDPNDPPYSMCGQWMDPPDGWDTGMPECKQCARIATDVAKATAGTYILTVLPCSVADKRNRGECGEGFYSRRCAGCRGNGTRFNVDDAVPVKYDPDHRTYYEARVTR